MTTADNTRVALVTGAGRGIGAAIAVRLHELGHRVALLDRDGDAVSALSGTLDHGAGTALPLRVDVDDAAAVRAALREVSGTWQAPDILVNNAARTAPGSVWDIEPDEWDAVMATNLCSVLILTRLCAPAMRHADGAAWSISPRSRASRAARSPAPTTRPPRRESSC